MRRISWMIALTLAALPARAADEPKPNALTTKEVADGWVLLFDGETTFGWKIDGEATVKDGVLKVGGDKPARVATTTNFGMGTVQFDCRWSGKTQPVASYPVVGPLDTKDIPAWDTKNWNTIKLLVTITKKAGEAKGQYYYSHLTKDGFLGSSGGVDIKTKAKLEEIPPLPFAIDVPAGSTLELRSVKYMPVLVPIFNGKDLTGWKKYNGDDKRNKTEFSVTKDGYLHLKNGPGDLQSEEQYDDFVLQVECRTNGKNLNSGVFFRCIPGDYQNGYEAQIHNGFDADKPKEYTVEEYDPKTHELKDKKKVKSPAVDYGTGAIYRRVPVRSQTSKDNEWFTMTVVAQGRHIATWVNGVQQVDWTDNRKDDKNPRNGYRGEKGPISLQGHDPTTDIDFREIRILELPRPKEK